MCLNGREQWIDHKAGFKHRKNSKAAGQPRRTESVSSRFNASGFGSEASGTAANTGIGAQLRAAVPGDVVGSTQGAATASTDATAFATGASHAAQGDSDIAFGDFGSSGG